MLFMANFGALRGEVRMLITRTREIEVEMLDEKIPFRPRKGCFSTNACSRHFDMPAKIDFRQVQFRSAIPERSCYCACAPQMRKSSLRNIFRTLSSRESVVE